MKNPTWTADELHNVITRVKNAVNKNKAFEQLSNETGRSYFSIQNKFYDYQEHFKTDVSKEERERGVRNLYNRGKSLDEIAKQYGMPSSAVKLILSESNIFITPKSKTKTSTRTKMQGIETKNEPVIKSDAVNEPNDQPKSKKVNKQNTPRFELNFLWGLLRITKQ
jgi:transposase-like protein